MKIVMCFMCGIIGIIASALDITTLDGTVYRNVKLKMAGDEEIKVTHSEGENIIKLDAIKPFDLKTADGRSFQGAQLNGIRRNSVVIECDGAVRNLKAEQLPQEIREAFGFTIAKPEPQKTLNNVSSDKSSNSTAEGSNSKKVENTNPSNPAYDAGKVFLQKLKQMPKPSNSSEYGITPQNIQKSVVFIRTENGSGSGFVCNLNGIPVIITNAHVYAKFPNPVIIDSDRHIYNAKSALVSKSRDLTIIEIDLPEGIIPLEIEPKVTDLPTNSGLVAYGDSLGGGVVTNMEGILQGFGPGEIEISAGIVDGNSGGPVVGENLRVIGVSTRLKKEPWKEFYNGTRFGNNDSDRRDRQDDTSEDNNQQNRNYGKNQPREYSDNKQPEESPGNRPRYSNNQSQRYYDKSRQRRYTRNQYLKTTVYRRFATRIDDINLDDFEILVPEQKQKDLTALKALQEANNSMFKKIEDNEFSNGFKLKMFFMKTYFPLNYVWDYKCSLSYLDKLLTEETQKARIISLIVTEPINNVSNLERQKAENIFNSIQSRRNEQFGCKRCHGTGSEPDGGNKITSRSIKFDENIFKSKEQSVYDNDNNYVPQKTCTFCHGNPKRKLISYNIHSSFLSSIVKNSPQKYSGLSLGCSEQVADTLLKPLLGEPAKIEYCGVVSVWQYKSNNVFTEAEITQLLFIAGRLESITIIFDNNQAIWQQLQAQVIQRNGVLNWSIDLADGNVTAGGIRGNDYSINIGKVGSKTILIFQHNMLSYLKYLVLNDIGENITGS